MPLFSSILATNFAMFDFVVGNNLLLLVIKYMFIIAGLFYSFFAYLITRQISLMSKTLSTTFSKRNVILGYVHLAAALVVLIYFLLVL